MTLNDAMKRLRGLLTTRPGDLPSLFDRNALRIAFAELEARLLEDQAKAKNDPPAVRHDVLIAWLLDREAQHVRNIDEDLLVNEITEALRHGAPQAAFQHGELDDVLPVAIRLLAGLPRTE